MVFWRYSNRGPERVPDKLASVFHCQKIFCFSEHLAGKIKSTTRLLLVDLAWVHKVVARGHLGLGHAADCTARNENFFFPTHRMHMAVSRNVLTHRTPLFLTIVCQGPDPH